MITSTFINDMIPPLKLTDEANKANLWMEELRLRELPVVDKGRFLGFITEDILFHIADDAQKISEIELTGQSCSVQEDRHIYDLIKVSTEHNLGSVAVINASGNYLGTVNINDTISFFSSSATVQSPGGVLVISIKKRDYSLSEISRLVEAENAKIIGSSLVEDVEDTEKVKLTLKINKTDLSRIIATLERFGYHIIAHYQEVVGHSNEKERLEILLKYLSI
jgi:acetoin utilization protein AcuB